MRRLAALVAACFLLPACPAFADSTVFVRGGLMQITGTGGDDSVTVSAVGNDVTVTNAVDVSDPGTCTVAGTTVTCPSIAALRADLLDGNDTFAIDSTPGQFSVPVDLRGGAGNDSLAGGAGIDLIFGQAGNDLVSGGAGNDLLDGGDGDDVVNGGDGDDIASGGNGRDTVSGNNDDDLVSGDEDDDDLHGNDGEDFVSGVGGGDDLDGGDGDDTLSGGEDQDRLIGGSGTDSMEGDEDIDVVTYADRSGPVTITVGNGLADDGAPGEGDEVGFSVENATGGAGGDTIAGSSLVNAIDGGAGDDTIELRDLAADTAACGAGNDTVHVDADDRADGDCETVDNGPAAPATPATGRPQVVTVTQPARIVVSPLRPRVSPRRVTLRIGPSRDRRAPYKYRVLGRLTLPRGVNPRLACGDVGLVDIQVRRGRSILLSLRPRLRSNCTFEARVNFLGPRRIRTTKLRFTASFLGNAYLSPARAKSVIARAG
jgi:hypothetical protein